MRARSHKVDRLHERIKRAKVELDTASTEVNVRRDELRQRPGIKLKEKEEAR